LTVARKLNFKLNEADALTWMGYAFLNMVNYPMSLQTLLSSLAIAENPKIEQNILPDKYLIPKEFLKRPVTAHMLRLSILCLAHHSLGILYGNSYNSLKEQFHDLQALQFAEESGHVPSLCTINNTLGRLYLSRRKPDSALIYEQKAYNLSIQTGYKKDIGSILLNLGKIQSDIGNKQLARDYFRRAVDVSIEQNYLRGVVAGNLLLAELYNQSGTRDSSLQYTNAALGVAKYQNSPDLLLRCYTALAAFYRSNNNNDSTVKYQELIIKMKDSSFNLKQGQQFQSIDFDAQQRPTGNSSC
jgi:tetratricopeptide (TPR) repeat protein